MSTTGVLSSALPMNMTVFDPTEEWGVTTPAEEESLYSIPQYQISEIMWRVVPPFIIVLGTFGNVMTVAVMYTMRSGGHSADQTMYVYFMSLAISDFAVLWVGLTRQWTRAVFDFDIRNVNVALCRIHRFLVFTFGRMATWFLVALTTERVMTVLWPLRHGMRSTKKKAIAIVLIITSACVLLDMAILVTYTHTITRSGRKKCKPQKDNELTAFYEDNVYPWLNIILGSLLPLFILVINNTVLGWKVKQSVKASRQMAGAEQAEARDKAATSLSITLVVTSVAFFLLTSSIPAGFFFKRFYLPSVSSDAHLEASVELADAVLDLLWYCNSAVNFYLYCLSGAKFRNEAYSILTCGWRSPIIAKRQIKSTRITSISESVLESARK